MSISQNERRDRKNTLISATRHGHQFWHDEQHMNNFGIREMQKYGWEVGHGLGKKQHGISSYIRTKQKHDSTGIGANLLLNGNADTWNIQQSLYNDLLKRLSADTQMGSSIDTSRVVTDDEERKRQADSKSDTLKSYLARRQLYGKFRKAKDVSNYDAKAMAEIMGEKSESSRPTSSSSDTKNNNTSLSTSSSTSSLSSVDINRSNDDDSNHVQTSTSQINLHDYFALKMKKQSSAAAAAAVASSSSNNSNNSNSSKYMSQEAYYDSMLHLSIQSGKSSHITGQYVQGGQRGGLGYFHSHRHQESEATSMHMHHDDDMKNDSNDVKIDESMNGIISISSSSTPISISSSSTTTSAVNMDNNDHLSISSSISNISVSMNSKKALKCEKHKKSKSKKQKKRKHKDDEDRDKDERSEELASKKKKKKRKKSKKSES